MATLTGEVLGERTVLNFSERRGKVAADHVIQHTGRMNYATGYQTQLQFSLHRNSPSRSVNVNHPPRPPPVIIERLPSQPLSTHDKLQMAALLARRDFRNGCIPAEFLPEQSEALDDSSSEEEQEVVEAHEQIIPLQTVQPQDVGTVAAAVLPAVKPRHSKPTEHGANVEKMASEVVALRRQLRRQVGWLREAVYARKMNNAAKDEDDIERELHREDGRGTIRHMQSLYSLQQQVQKLKSDLDKQQKCSTVVRDTKKSLAMKQLTASHRSAIRLMQSLAGMSDRPAVYRQLSELMQQLTMCCCQLGLDGTQLVELNDQMKALEKEIVELDMRNAEELAVLARLKEQTQPTRKHSRPPFQRQHQRSTLIPARQPDQKRGGRFRAQTFSSLMRKKTRPTRPKPKSRSPSRIPKYHKSPAKRVTLSPPLRPLAVKKVVKPLVNQDDARLPTVPASKVHKLKKRGKRQRGRKQHHEVVNSNAEELVLDYSSNGSKKGSPCSINKSDSSVSERSSDEMMSPADHVILKHPLTSTSTPMPTQTTSSRTGSKRPPVPDSLSNQSPPEHLELLQQMLVRISQMEEEKMRLQQRWSHVTYRDAAVKPVVCTPSPSPTATAMTLSVPPNMLKSVSHHRDRFHHHLKLKGAMTGLDWETSEFLEQMSEEILDEILTSTIDELDQLCEHYAHSVYASEFAVPNANI